MYNAELREDMVEVGSNKSLNTEHLRTVVSSFVGVPIAVIGDLIVDHYIWGKVDRISPEAPVVVVNVSEENKRLGGAGNVAHNLVSLGASVSLFGVVGDDVSGRELIRMCDEVGIDATGVMVDRSRPTSVKTRVIGNGQQVVRVDREDISTVHPTFREGLSAALVAKIPEVNGVIVSDYGKGTISEPLMVRAVRSIQEGIASEKRTRILVDPKAPNFMLYRGASIIKPNRKEAEEASGKRIKNRKDAIGVAGELLKLWECEMVLITLGEFGMVLATSGAAGVEVIEIDTDALEVFDVSGAGDTVSATFMLALASGSSSADAALIANAAAGIVVGEIGTVAVTREQLSRNLHE